jgi:hypothetical protein
MPAGGVDHELRDREGRDLVDPLVEQPLLLDLELPEASDPGADDDAAPEGILLLEVDARRRDGILRGSSFRLAMSSRSGSQCTSPPNCTR